MTIDTVLTIIAAAATVLGVPVIQWIKIQFALSGKVALALSTVVSLVLGATVALVSGQIVPGEELTLELVGQAWAAVFSMATLVYKALAADPGKK